MMKEILFILYLFTTIIESFYIPSRELNNINEDTIKKRFPNAIIIGVKKSGTRALLEFLKINPRIKAPGPEVHFFDKHYDLGYDWYK